MKFQAKHFVTSAGPRMWSMVLQGDIMMKFWKMSRDLSKDEAGGAVLIGVKSTGLCWGDWTCSGPDLLGDPMKPTLL